MELGSAADGAQSSTDAVVLSDAYSTARELLHRAEEDADRIRADADRYMRQREQEAELLVGKARRLLAMAEERAVAPQPAAIDLDAPASVVIDLDAPAPAAAWDPGSAEISSELDSMVAIAVSNAIHRALPSDP